MNSKCVMLIGDSYKDDLSDKTINGINADDVTIMMGSAEEALLYLESGSEPKADMIFLDIHMPVMDGREFLQGYFQLDEAVRRKTMIVMLAITADPSMPER